MKIKYVLISLIIISIGFGKVKAQGRLLEKAYKKNSTELLKEFFMHWNAEIPSLSDHDLSKLNDIQKYTYQAFTAFYKPMQIDSFCGSKRGDNIYTNVEFLIVQNYIDIYSCEKIYYTDKEEDEFIVNYINQNIKNDSIKQKRLERKNGKLSDDVIQRFSPNLKSSCFIHATLIDSIENFRPKINCKGKTPVYLNSKYKNILNKFLGDEHLSLGAGGIMNPARSIGESQERKKFIENDIKIWYAHNGGYWQLKSYPVAYSIIFDKQMKFAQIYFGLIYKGGEALLERVGTKWILKSAKLTWIE